MSSWFEQLFSNLAVHFERLRNIKKQSGKCNPTVFLVYLKQEQNRIAAQAHSSNNPMHQFILDCKNNICNDIYRFLKHHDLIDDSHAESSEDEEEEEEEEEEKKGEDQEEEGEGEGERLSSLSNKSNHMEGYHLLVDHLSDEMQEEQT